MKNPRITRKKSIAPRITVTSQNSILRIITVRLRHTIITVRTGPRITNLTSRTPHTAVTAQQRIVHRSRLVRDLALPEPQRPRLRELQ